MQAGTRGAVDVVVIGGGPAGSYLARVAAERGLSVLLADPAWERVWPQNLCLWEQEVMALGAAGYLARTWSSASVMASTGVQVPAGEGYALLDGGALRAAAAAAIHGAGGRIVVGAVEGVEARGDHVMVSLSDASFGDGQVRAPWVIDCTGFRPRWSAGPPGEPAWQTAYGVTLRVPPSAAPRIEEAVVMDWRPSPAERAGEPASFLYMLPMQPGEVFVEETVLAARPEVPLALLEARLRARCEAMGWQGAAILDVERCRIPMGGGIPPQPAEVVPFGGAAGFVHPATGYQVARAWRRAHALVDVLASHPEGEVRERAEAAWRALWPAPAQRREAIYAWGLASTLGFSAPELRAFFDAFFRLPPPLWRAYLQEGLSAGEMLGLMARTFAAAPWSTRVSLMASMRRWLPGP